MKNQHPPYISPPPWADRFLEWFCSPDLIDEFQGDLHEQYQKNIQQKGKKCANVHFIFDVIRLFRPSSMTRPSYFFYSAMYRNYFITALRNFKSQKAYTFINVAGLSIGLACAILIALWVNDELKVDQFHEHGDRLYRLDRHVSFSDGNIYTWQSVPKPLAQVLEKDIPEVEHAELVQWDNQHIISIGDKAYREKGKHLDTAFFEIFSFPLIEGTPTEVLKDPDAIVISESLATKYFGADWKENNKAVGQILRVDNSWDAKVTGVFEDVPNNSTMRFDIAMSMSRFLSTRPWLDHWGNSSLQIYVRLKEGADLAAVNAKIEGLIDKNHEGANAKLFLHPYEDIYLRSDFKDGQLVGGRIEYVRIFSLVALFILIIAAINFMNLASARASKRAREIGIRKVVGANRSTIFQQFMGESMLIALMALALSIVIVEMTLPSFNEMTEKELAIEYLNPINLVLLIGIALFAGFLSGVYPALFLSSIRIIHVLKGTLKYSFKGAALRKGLVVFQFTLSILLIISTLTMYQQINYIQTKNLGLDKDNLLFMSLEGKMAEQYEAFRQELLNQPGIVNVTTSSQDPLSVGNSTSDPTWEGKDPNSSLLFSIINANYDFVETMKMEIVKGRSFSNEFATDTANYIINEATARAMGMENPVGQMMEFWQRKGQIVGVVKDFHFASLYTDIDPLIIRMDPEETWMMFVRIDATQTETALAALEKLHGEFNPSYPFQYRFLDENFQRTYKSEFTTGKLSNAFAVMAIFISCLGLFGLASFTAERRTKEISIRKILGASVSRLTILLFSDFTWLVLVAFAIAAPLGWLAMNNWLDSFEYHIDISLWVFILAGVAAMLIAWLTIGYQSMRLAMANPVKSLRTE